MLSECLTFWIQIRTHILSVLIWFKTICKGYQQVQQSTKVAASKDGGQCSFFYLLLLYFGFSIVISLAQTGLRSAVGNMSGYRCVSDCNSRGREFDLGPVPYFCGDWSWNNFYGHSPPFRWFIQEGLLSVTSESMCTNYWLSACSSLPRKKCG